MKRLILLASLLALALTGQAQNFTTGTWNKVNAKDTLVVSGRAIAEVVYSVLVTSKNNEVPTAKAVWDLVQSQIGDKISGTGETPRVAYFTNNDEIGGDPDLTFDDADNILLVQDIMLDGTNNEVTAGFYYGGGADFRDANARASIVTTSASSASNGGFVVLGNDDGAAMANGHQLGKITFSGNTGAANGNEGATIEAYAEGLYTGSSQPTGIRFTTTPNGSNVGVQRVWISENGDLSILTGKGLRWWDSDGSNYIELKAPSLSANRSWTWPSDAPANGEVLTWNTGDLLSWEAAGGGSSFYQTWKANGTPVTQRANANFLSTADIVPSLADDSGSNETEASFDIPAGAVEFSEMQNLSTNVLMGNAAVAPGPPLEIGLGTQFFVDGVTLKLDQNSATTGQVYKWSGSVWAPAADGPGISLGTANQIFGINAAGTANEYKTLQGTTNRVSVTHGAGTVTLSAPQDLHTDASPQFNSMTLLNTGGNNSLTLQSTGSTSGMYINAVSPFIYATDIAPSGSNAGMGITFFQNDGAANVSGDRLGYFNFSGRGVSSSERISASFRAFADGSTFTNSSSPGRLVWATTPSGSTTPVDRVQIRQTGVMEMMSGNPLQFWDSDNTNYVELKVPATGTLTANRSFFLPSDAPSNGEQLTWNTGDILTWEAAGGGSAFYQTLQIGGTDQTQRAKLNISPTAQINVSYSDDAGNNRSNVEFSIANDAVGTDQIDDGSVGAADLNQMGASTTQVLTWTGSTWAAQYVSDDQHISDLSGDVDNWSPTNWATSTIITVGGDATIRAITGFAALPGGTERTIINTSLNAIYIPCLHPDSDGANQVVGPSDIIIPSYWAVTIVYSNNFSKWYLKTPPYNPALLGVTHKGLFFSQMPGSTNQSDQPFLGLAVSGTGATQANQNPTTALPQSWTLETGTTATGLASIYIPKNANNFTAYGSAHISASALVYVPTASTSGQRYTLQFSLIGGANSTTLAVNNSIGLRYSDNINSGEWEFFTRNNSGTESTFDTNVAVSTNTLYLLTVSVDKARSEARCYINGQFIGRITSNLPNAVVCGLRLLNIASVGTTNKIADLCTITGFAVY